MNTVGKSCAALLVVALTLLLPRTSEAFQRLHRRSEHPLGRQPVVGGVTPSFRSASNKALLSPQNKDYDFEHSQTTEYTNLNQSGSKDTPKEEKQKPTRSTMTKLQFIKSKAKNTVAFPKRGLRTIFRRLSNVRKIETNTESNSSLPVLAAASSLVALPSAITPRKLLYGSILFLVSCMIMMPRQQRERILYPGSHKIDPSYSDFTIPTDGTYDGCPFIGPLGMFSDYNKWFSVRSAKLGNSNFFKLYSFAKPSVMIAGSKRIKELLDREFTNNNVGKVSQFFDFGDSSALLFGKESMSGVRDDKKEYQGLRKLVGESMTPKSLRLAVPALQEAVETTLDEILATAAKDGSVNMKDYMHQFTQDVSWKQIIGLNLRTQEEITKFRRAMTVWLEGFTNVLLLFLPPFFLRHDKSVKAKRYLDQVVGEKIDELQKSGQPATSDGTALSAMVFATSEDEEEGSGKVEQLTREQIIDNTALLLLAGSETTANTLTNAIYLLGTHKNVWNEIVQEQERVISEKGTDKITKELLDQDCPYLTAVVNEVLRLRPVSGGGARLVDETAIVNGKQIPKGWLCYFGVALTHEQDPITFEPDGTHMDLEKGFKPERWLDDATKPTTEFIPFGVGNRFCLGYALALMEMKLFLAVMARRKIDFELVHESLHPNKKRKWKEGIILTPVDGSKVYIQQKEV